MKTAYQYFLQEAESIRASGLWKDERIITTPQSAYIDTTTSKKVLNMCANNYLGLSNHPKIIEAAKKSYDLYDWFV